MNTKQETEFNLIYNEVLKYFGVTKLYTSLLETRHTGTTYRVTMDNIHDAFLSVGFYNQPVKYYIIRSKQFAINDYNIQKRRYNILKEHINQLLPDDFDYTNVEHYDFTIDEFTIVIELINGIKRYKSSIARKKYDKILQDIIIKVKASL